MRLVDGVGVTRADARRGPLRDECVQCVVTSPPYYGLRDYGVAGQIGLEQTPTDYVAEVVTAFREVRRVLRPDGVVWLVLGDSYAVSGKGGKEIGLKPKDLIGIPWMIAFALRDDGWYLRSDVIWSKPNPMPESVTDRPTRAHEYVFLLSRSGRYFYDAGSIKTPPKMEFQWARWTPGQNPHTLNRPRRSDKQRGHSRRHSGFNDRWDKMSKLEQSAMGANARSVWEMAPSQYRGAHFATYLPELVRRCILAGSRPGDLVFDPFTGSGTTGLVAAALNRRFVGGELNPKYITQSVKRLSPIAFQVWLTGLGRKMKENAAPRG